MPNKYNHNFCSEAGIPENSTTNLKDVPSSHRIGDSGHCLTNIYPFWLYIVVPRALWRYHASRSVAVIVVRRIQTHVLVYNEGTRLQPKLIEVTCLSSLTSSGHCSLHNEILKGPQFFTRLCRSHFCAIDTRHFDQKIFLRACAHVICTPLMNRDMPLATHQVSW